ncbi:MAG: hypothetical protein C0468_02455, partial [Planctomyces sp.]|nr:hypothetical protein [Planctomyces sp.]
MLAIVIGVSLYRTANFLAVYLEIGGVSRSSAAVADVGSGGEHTKHANESISRMRKVFAEAPQADKDVDERFYQDTLALAVRLDELTATKQWTDATVDEVVSYIFTPNPIKLTQEESDTLVPPDTAARQRRRTYSFHSSRRTYSLLMLLDRVERGLDRGTRIDARLRTVILDNIDHFSGSIMNSYLAYDPDMIAAV